MSEALEGLCMLHAGPLQMQRLAAKLWTMV